MSNLGSFMRSTGHYAQNLELMQMIRRMDTNGDGKLSF